jgi:lipopolysaccharide/colanic/teichoic acid biosynthesis glycosyltransferase
LGIERLSREFYPFAEKMSRWSESTSKRVFDCVCVVLALPVLAPLAFLVAASVRLTSPGPVFFLQRRVGRYGRVFTIFKFRTIIHVAGGTHTAITTLDNQPFTPVGLLLRRWKLDELPQLVNVLLGHMSLVGPRPKIVEHSIFHFPCRPGITGMATVAFAEEESILSCVPRDQLVAYYYNVVLPAKHKMDLAYHVHATLLSDLQLLARSVLRRWDFAAGESFIAAAQHEWEHDSPSSGFPGPGRMGTEHLTVRPHGRLDNPCWIATSDSGD